MVVTLKRPLYEDKVVRLPWWKWRAHLYGRVFVEPLWLYNMRMMWKMSNATLRTYDECLRRTWFVKRWPHIDKDEYFEVEREVELTLSTTEYDAEPGVGYMSAYVEAELVSVVYTDTGLPYEGDWNVWNDDIEKWCADASPGNW